MGKAIQTVFKRREKKYLVTKAQAEQIWAVLSDVMQPDEYGQYTICNIYFDTEDDALIRRSIEKPVFKEKLRARSYGIPTEQSKVFLEIKRKFKGVVYKRRVSLSYKELQTYLQTGRHPPKQAQIFSELDYFLQFYKPVPKLYLAYDRVAFKGIDEPGLRITFDSNIRFRRTQLYLGDGDFGAMLLDPELYVMEIKSDGAMPIWLCTLLNSMQLYPISFSKYGKVFQKQLQNQRGA